MKTSTLSRHMPPAHMKATRMLGYGLTLADYAGWAAASAVWSVHLRPSEMAAIALAALGAMDDESYIAVQNFLEGQT